MLIFAGELLYHAPMGNDQQVIPDLKARSQLFRNVYSAKLIPNSMTTLFCTGQQPREFIILDLNNPSAHQKRTVCNDIRSVDCNSEFIIVATVGKVELYSWNRRGHCIKLNEFGDYYGPSEPCISAIGDIAFITESSQLTVYKAKACFNNYNRNSSKSWGYTRISFKSSGKQLLGQFDCGIHFYDIRTLSTFQPGGLQTQPSFGRLMKAISDDDRNFLFSSGNCYTVVTMKEHYGNRSLPFTLRVEIEALEESFVFLRIDGIQHLQFVTADGVLLRYKIDEARTIWTQL